MAGRNSIYEVFRACRLCGGGGGYKMPIVNLEDELDMRHKIRECVRIEVHREDKMPPLICELCVDKVNDYFEFLEMCRATDTRTRDRLGLPQPALSHTGNDSGDCILGVTEPVFVNDDSNDGEPLSRQRNKLLVGGKGKKIAAAAPAKKGTMSPIPIISITRSGIKDMKTGMKGLKVNMNGSKDSSGSSRSSSAARSSSRSAARAPSPPARRSLRDDSKDSKKSKSEKEKNAAAWSARDTRQKGAAARPSRDEDKSLLREKPRPLSKREREREKEDARSAKRVKIAVKVSPPPRPRPEKRRAPTPPRPEPKRKAVEQPPAPTHACSLCKAGFARVGFLTQHLRAAHSPTLTPDKLACNACGEWFRTAEEANTHHRWHKSAAPYVCRLCTAEFKQHASYTKHFASKQCVPSTEVPDVQCPTCWLNFPTAPLLDKHRCRGEDARPGGNCAKCKRRYATYKTLRRHEETCLKPGPRSRGGKETVSPELLRRVQPMQIRIARCDPLLASVKLEQHYDVSHVARNFGLDKNCVYPYISSVRSMRIKDEPHDYDISRVKNETEDDFCFEDTSFADYESFTDSDSESEAAPKSPNMVLNPFARKKKSIDALSTLSIKAIFSSKFLGQKKIQRKRKRRLIVKPEIKAEENEAFDALVKEPIDKEMKSELIEACNKDGEVVDLGSEKDKEKVVDVDAEKTEVTTEGREKSEGATTTGGENNDDAKSDTAVLEKGDLENEKSDSQDAIEFGNLIEQVDNMFDDVGMDQDVTSAVNNLIADLNEFDDVEGKICDDKDDKEVSKAKEDEKKSNEEKEGAKESNERKDAEKEVSKTSDSEKDDSKTKDDIEASKVDDEEVNKANDKVEVSKEKDEKEIFKDKNDKSTEHSDEIVKDTANENKVSDENVEATKMDTETKVQEKSKTSEVEEEKKEIESKKTEEVKQSAEEILEKNEGATAQKESETKNKKEEEEDMDFDINAIFSGDLGPTALKAKGKPVHSDESKPKETNAENPAIDVRLQEEVTVPTIEDGSVSKDLYKIDDSSALDGVVNSKVADDSSAAKSASKDEQNKVLKDPTTEDEKVLTKSTKDEEVLKDTANKDEVSKDTATKVEVSKDTATKDEVSKDTATKVEVSKDKATKVEVSKDTATKVEVSKDTATKNVVSKDASTKDVEASKDAATKDDEDELLKDKISDAELENISDTEMDDYELMDELDAQISGKQDDLTATQNEGKESNTELNKDSLSDVTTQGKDLEEKISLDELLMATAEVNPSRTDDEAMRESMDLDSILSPDTLGEPVED